MKENGFNYYGMSRAWWLILIVGILMIAGGFCYWFWPVNGYAVASLIFGWLLVIAGVIQVCVSAGRNPQGWGWWLAGGIIDMFVGFCLVRSLPLAEEVFPYFMAFIFLFWGIEQLVSACTGRKLWWLGLINGLLMCFVAFLFVEGGLRSTVFMSSFLVAIAFIYWGFTISVAALEMKPQK